MKANGLRTRQIGKASLRGLTSLFLAQGCAVCDRPARQPFCIDCQRQILPASVGRSRRLPTLPTADSNRLPVMSLGIYEGMLKRAILKLKYGDRPDIARPLGAALARQWLAQPPFAPNPDRPGATKKLYALPIPLHPSRYRVRGYNQAELIAQAFCRVSGLPLLPQGLARIQATLPMHQLSLPARQQNLTQAFQIGPSLQRTIRPSVILIDDIYTTGTTAQSAADTLNQAGVCVRGMLVLARATL